MSYHKAEYLTYSSYRKVYHFGRLLTVHRFNPRVLDVNNKKISDLVNFINEIDFTIISKKHVRKNLKDLFTICITVHDAEVEFYRECLNSVLRQTYKNIELIIIEHGTSVVIKEINRNLLKTDGRIKILHVPLNVPENYFNLVNAALFISNGQYFSFISYDDYLSPNYAEVMVSLFKGNSSCVTAAPLPVSIDEFGNLNSDTSNFYKLNNKRPRYTAGVDLVLSYVNPDGKISFPGGVLAHKTSNLLEHGAFDKWNDVSQLIRFALWGDSGFSSRAKLYWRHHKKQTNVENSKLGMFHYHAILEYYRTEDFFEIHSNLVNTVFAKQVYEFFVRWANYEVMVPISRQIDSRNFANLFNLYARLVKEVPWHVIIQVTLKIFLNILNKIRLALSTSIFNHLSR